MFGNYSFFKQNKMFLQKIHLSSIDKSSLHLLSSNLCQINLNISRNLKNRPTNLKINKRNFSTFTRKDDRFERNLVKSLENYQFLMMPRRLKLIEAQNLVRTCMRCYSTRINHTSKNNESNQELPPSESGDQEYENIKTLFTSPKNVLHNAYDTVAKQLQNAALRISPAYSPIREHKQIKSWMCTYNLLWPEQKKFVRHGHTKQDASHKAALAALTWLRSINKLTRDGLPIVYDRNEVKTLVKKTRPTLTLDNDTIDCMNDIIERHKNVFVPALINNLEDRNNNNQESWDGADDAETVELGEVQFRRKIKPKQFRLNQYLTREKVNLPIAQFKDEFVTLLKENRVVIVKGEPGCGKSTRVPQYVLESWAKEAYEQDDDDGYTCRIAVTQPRRIAAVSLAERVAHERDESVGHIVGYQVRLKSNFKLNTGRILYCTTGILLRHLQSDPYLENFSHIIIDEAHERDINTDLLMNLLKTIVMENNPKLKVIIMSATIDSGLFNKYFTNAPCMHIPGFTHPVQEHFIKELPIDLYKTESMCNQTNPSIVHEDVVRMIEYIHKNKPEGAILCFLPGWEDITKIQKLIPKRNDLYVLCLHSRLQDQDQYKIFSRPPPGVRKIILSTNIAETSVTIDDVVYVIDTGIHKENRFDNDKGVYCIDNHWITKSNMKQRKGRAGRVRSGESYHLYTTERFNEFDEYAIPEILRSSLTKIVLDSKIFSNNMDTIEFFNQLPSPPDQQSLQYAINELKDLELFDDNENLTPLGRVLVNFQLEPKLAKTLINSIIYKCCTPIVDIITLFSSDIELFTTGLIDKNSIKQIKSQFSNTSDHLAIMRIFEKWLELSNNDGYLAQKFCNDTNLIQYKLFTIQKLRQLHFDYLYNGLYDSLGISDQNSDNDELVKAVLLSGVGTLLQYRNWDIVKGRYKKTNLFITNKDHKATITSGSVNFKKTEFPSDYFVYINETRSNIRRTTLIRECSIISPLAVLLFSHKMLQIREELDGGQVVLGLTNTKVEFLCSKEQAVVLIKCKEALNAGYQYYIFQMTEGKEFDKDINQTWDEILDNVSQILAKHAV